MSGTIFDEDGVAELERIMEESGEDEEEDDVEEDLLDMAVTDRRDGSRLACQIRVTEALDGLTVDIPPQQS